MSLGDDAFRFGGSNKGSGILVVRLSIGLDGGDHMMTQSWGVNLGATCHGGMENKEFPRLLRIDCFTPFPGDIGTHFPDTDPKYKGISSEVLMKRVLGIMNRGGFHIINGDVTVSAQKPRLSPFFAEIRKRLSELLKVSEGSVNVKVGTTEGLG